MSVYESRRNAENRIEIRPEWRDSIVMGPEQVVEALVQAFKAAKPAGRSLRVAFDGWYGIDWKAILEALERALKAQKCSVATHAIGPICVSSDEIAAYRRRFTQGSDPGFGVVNDQGCLSDIVSPERLQTLKLQLERSRQTDVVIVFGTGAALPELDESYDLRFYFDKTRQPVLKQLWEKSLVPFGCSEPAKDYAWKDYNYCDYHLLDRQKSHALARMDCWVEGISFETLKLVPRAAYDGIIQTLVKYPIKEVAIYHPGPWGAYRYKDRPEIDVPGLPNNAWNLLIGPELSVLIDVGREALLNLPKINLLQYGEAFLGKHLTETYPRLFPIEVWLDDGYFPKPEQTERTSMPIHNHPGTDYVQRNFKEPLGRYETYYIAEAYEGANTWLGFKDDADLQEWERLCRESNNEKEIQNWKDFIQRWDSNVGDLYLIPPGTTHGSGGNQLVLEMDTCPSIAATEYSFFMYDFARHTWDDTKKSMTAKPCRMHPDHGFAIDKTVRASWARDNLRARPKVVKWTKEYAFDRYSSDPRMPFEIERFHFSERAENDTEGKFLHAVTLTVGTKVILRSRKDPKLSTTIHRFQCALVPAAFGPYEFVNDDKGACTIVQMRWKRG
jgi:hypothetical protein